MSFVRVVPVSLAFASLVLLAPLRAGAQSTLPSSGEGIDTHLFRPAIDSRGLLSVNGADVVRAGGVSLGLVMDYGRNVLRVREAGQSGALIDHAFTGTFHLDYGIGGRAVVGVAAPVVLTSGRSDVQSFQHLALHGKLELARPSGPVGVALVAQVGVPVSDAPRSAAADPAFWYWPMAVVEKRLGSRDELRIAANVGYRGHAASETALDLEAGRVRDGGRFTWGVGASYRIMESVDVLAETYGTYLLSDSTAIVRASNEALLGLKVFVEKSSYLVLGAGPRYGSGFEAADIRGVLGFVFEPPAGDTDGDGVRDDDDECPTIAGVRTASGKNGCPLDSDGDGILDLEDACPFVKGPRTNDPRTNGCPPIREVVKMEDRDQDGIPDAEDACPDLKGERHPDPKRNGCPDVVVGPTIITVFDKILFKTGSAEILPESNPILDKVAAVFVNHPELVLVEVAGHADERGAEKMNLALTQARVDSVMQALAARSVERSRLRAKGYGYYCPREEGHDEEAWSKNRRVEFLIVKTTAGPTNVPLGCENASAHGVRPAPVP